MTKTPSTFHTIVLKNIDPEDAGNGARVASIIVEAAQSRPHLRGRIGSFQWDRERGIGILVDDAGVRDHLANALDIPTRGTPGEFSIRGVGTGFQRSGEVGGFQVTIWNLEH